MLGNIPCFCCHIMYALKIVIKSDQLWKYYHLYIRQWYCTARVILRFNIDSVMAKEIAINASILL